MAESESDGVSNPSSHLSDIISSLPDDILHHIFSFIQLKLAITTSVLSKRWKHVWCEAPSLNIDCCGVTHPSSIEKSLISLAPKIKSLHLNVCPNFSASHVDSLIKLAISRKAENLSFIIFEAKYRFSDFFFVNSSVKQLCVRFGVYDKIPRCNVSWTSLRSLSFQFCKLSDESIANILSGCKRLESLTLKSCTGRLDHLDLSKSLRLTRLDIDCFQRPMHITAPHIYYLRLAYSWQPYSLVNVSSLTEANLNLFYLPSEFIEPATGFDFLQDTVSKMIAKLQNIEKLTIGAIYLQILSVSELRRVPFPQLKIKTLVVETKIVQSVIPGITRLLKNSPELKKITIVHTMKCNAISDDKLDGYLKAKGLDPNKCWNWFDPTVEQTSSSSDGIITKEARLIHVASFMKLVMKNTKALETVVLWLGGYLNTIEYQTLHLVVAIDSSLMSAKRKSKKYGQRKAILKCIKIIP